MLNHKQLESYNYYGLHKGPSLLVLGAIHGNETCGSKAIKKINKMLTNGYLTILSGSITMIPISNPLAYELKTRNGQRNLNRNFYPKTNPRNFEDHLNNILCPIISKSDVILDLHSFNRGDVPFALINSIENDHSVELIIDNEKKMLKEKTFADWLGVSTIVGDWTKTYEKGVSRRINDFKKKKFCADEISLDKKYGVGTTEFSREKGAIAATLECGLHSNPNSEIIGYNAILNILSNLKMITKEPSKCSQKQKRFLSLFEVIDKENPSDSFAKNWSNFDIVDKGFEIAKRASGELILAPKRCYIIFPNKNAKPGQEWFYLAE